MSEKEQYDNEVIDLFREHSGVMLGSLIRRGVPHPVAEEIVNDVFTALRIHWDRLRGENHMAYAYRIAANECKKWWRQEGEPEQRRYYGDLDVPDDRDEYQEIIDRIYLGQALQGLSPRERQTVHLRFIRQKSVKEAADDMGVSEGAVKGYTRDALRKLRERADRQITKSGEEEQ
ncbi:RNA polymerase sigma factor [Streptomyces sp. NPDC050504]|uniref:RNA polymerase sigma factor n=1 Tax=Streptomyces sp. NPDC050504 TaxID=3365618 RepID=UPI00378F5A28